MARDFTKDTANTLALGTSVLGTIMNGASAISFAAWIYADTLSGSSGVNNNIFRVLIDGTNSGFGMNISTTAGVQLLRVLGRSVAGSGGATIDGTTTITTGQWWHVGGVVDIGGDFVTPYVSGVAEGASAFAFTTATYTQGVPTSADAIGGSRVPSALAAAQWDGRIAELAMWRVDIGANAFAALGRGVSPFGVSPTLPVAYVPLWGIHSPEIDLRDAVVGTIAGSVPQANHAPVAPFSSRLWGSVPFLGVEAATLFRRNLFLRTGSRGAMGGL